jgi:hypothetical protein
MPNSTIVFCHASSRYGWRGEIVRSWGIEKFETDYIVSEFFDAKPVIRKASKNSDTEKSDSLQLI